MLGGLPPSKAILIWEAMWEDDLAALGEVFPFLCTFVFLLGHAEHQHSGGSAGIVSWVWGPSLATSTVVQAQCQQPGAHVAQQVASTGSLEDRLAGIVDAGLAPPPPPEQHGRSLCWPAVAHQQCRPSHRGCLRSPQPLFT